MRPALVVLTGIALASGLAVTAYFLAAYGPAPELTTEAVVASDGAALDPRDAGNATEGPPSATQRGSGPAPHGA